MIKEEKVQFFNSESSFGSQSSLNDSRYFDLTNQIRQQTENVLLTLKRELQPTQQLTNLDKIDYLANRAIIIARDNAPQHLHYLDKIEAPKQSIDACKESVRKLENFIKDYQALKQDKMQHKHFYNIYGRGLQNNLFFKKQSIAVYSGQVNTLLEPDIVSLGEAKSSRARAFQQRKTISTRNAQTISFDKQLMQLQQQIATLKRRQHDMKKQFQQMITTEKLNSQKRVNTLLKALIKKNQNPYSTLFQENYKNEAIRLGEEIQTILSKKQEDLAKNAQMDKKIHDLELVNQMLKQELSGYKRMENSRIDEDEQMNRSFQSQQNMDDSHNTRKLSLQIKKLSSERDILRNQLQRQRQAIQRKQIRTKNDQTQQITRLRNYLQSRNAQNQELHRQIDKMKVELIQAREENKLLMKKQAMRENVYNGEEMRRIAYYNNGDGPNNLTGISSLESSTAGKVMTYRNRIVEQTSVARSLQKQLSTAKINSFEEYQGEGIEGYPYFQLLSRQFRIRFKRACLKQKQLLYKSNGIQIGVITQFIQPNQINILVHVTNSTEKNINNFHGKTMNPNQNKIQSEVEEIPSILPNQQVKIPVNCLIKNYPIGPVVLAINYFTDQKNDVRLLLPVHIFKCVSIEPRKEPFYKANKVLVKVQKKVCKDLQTLKEYLNCQNQNDIKVQIRHQHSNSLMFLNAKLEREQLLIQYEHISGTERFTQYFIKTFKTLLQKQN